MGEAIVGAVGVLLGVGVSGAIQWRRDLAEAARTATREETEIRQERERWRREHILNSAASLLGLLPGAHKSITSISWDLVRLPPDLQDALVKQGRS